MARRVAITGAAGQLGRELVRAFAEAGDEALALSRPDFDITDDSHLGRLTAWRPDIVVNAAAWTDVEGCARDPERAMRLNGDAAGDVAEAAAEAGAFVVQISTNEVFDGTLDRPYVEDDQPNPINPYGASKLAGERSVAGATPEHLIVRTAWLFGPGGNNFVTKILSAAHDAQGTGRRLRVVSDEWGNPTPTPWLASAIVGATSFDVRGVLHLAGQPIVSRLDWARFILAEESTTLDSVLLRDYVRLSRVPARAALSTLGAEGLGLVPPNWHDATAELTRAARSS